MSSYALPVIPTGVPLYTHGIAVGATKTDRRCLSLRTGARAWGAEVKYRGGARKGAVLLTLTLDAPRTDAEVSREIGRFWDWYSHRFGRVQPRRCQHRRPLHAGCKAWAVRGTKRCHAHGGRRPTDGSDKMPPIQRLSWLEYQANGRHHYHAIIIDPPSRSAGHTWQAIRDGWGNGRTQLLWRNADWVDNRAIKYAVSYAKKFGEKSYQQQYEQATRQIRTFQTNRLRSADARVERLPRWAIRDAEGRGWQVVDGGRPRGGGVRVDASQRVGDHPGPTRPFHVSRPHRIPWETFTLWPADKLCILLGEPHWQPLPTTTPPWSPSSTRSLTARTAP